MVKSAHRKTEFFRGMTNKNIIQTISEKEMDRKEFLKYSGVALLSLVGLKGLATLINSGEFLSDSKKSETRSFGNGKYGR